ncbi:hypothetical protein [Haladaptatus sp. DFWS20]|uniref:hypothetical protein n=1 Tax=Haladaptatus sp. DFWS20 TaxID=3403467 RepID=UPI003EB7FF58
MVAVVVVFLQSSTLVLELGILLTVLAWGGLLVVVLHGRYVVERIAAGTYQNAPADEAEKSEQYER